MRCSACLRSVMSEIVTTIWLTRPSSSCSGKALHRPQIGIARSARRMPATKSFNAAPLASTWFTG
jgi:hypothetical protein